MEVFQQEEVQACMEMLSRAEDPSDTLLAWARLNKKHEYLSAMIALPSYKRSFIPASVKKYTIKPHDYLVPYFSSEKLYFLSDELISKTFASGHCKFEIDYTLMFDSNIATHINTLVRGRSLGAVHEKFIALIDNILYDDLNFDYLFYMVENIKNVYRKISDNNPSKLSFWRSLNRGFRQNMVSLKIFGSVDCKEYKKTSNPKPQLSYSQATRDAIEACYNFYASNDGKKNILNFLLLQRVLLLHIIGMVRIQLSSDKNEKNKMKEYCKYIQEVVGVYFDREAIIAHKYFTNRNSVKFFGKVHKGCSKVMLLRRLDNIAWDMLAPRFMENLIISLTSQGKYFVPMFLTFDVKLRELLSLYPVKGVIFHRGKRAFSPLPEINTHDYFKQHGCLEELEYLHSEQVRSERLQRRPTQSNIYALIRREYKLLRSVI